MKKVLIVLGALGVLMISVVAMAETVIVEESSAGELRIMYPRSLSSTWLEVTFDKGVLDYGDKWKESYRKPYKVVPVESHWRNMGRVGLFHSRLIRIVDVGIIRDATGVHLVHNVSEESSGVLNFNPYFIFWLGAIVLTTIFFFRVWILRKRKKLESNVKMGGREWTGTDPSLFLLFLASIILSLLVTFSLLVTAASSIPLSIAAAIVADIALGYGIIAEDNEEGERRERFSLKAYVAGMVLSLLAFWTS